MKKAERTLRMIRAPWSHAHDSFLIQAFADGQSSEQIALALNRNISTINEHKRSLGIREDRQFIKDTYHFCATCGVLGAPSHSATEAWIVNATNGWFMDRNEEVYCPAHAPKQYEEPIIRPTPYVNRLLKA